MAAIMSGTTLPVTATSWTPGLVPGTNRCDINYALNNYPNVSFTVPVTALIRRPSPFGPLR